MRSPRQLKVGEEIRHALAMLFERGDVHWPRGFAAPMVTITEVQISPDLHNATVFFTTLNGELSQETLDILKEMVGFFRHEIAKKVRLRYVPNLFFKVDASFEYAQKIEKLLNNPNVAKDLVREDGEMIEADDDEKKLV